MRGPSGLPVAVRSSEWLGSTAAWEDKTETDHERLVGALRTKAVVLWLGRCRWNGQNKPAPKTWAASLTRSRDFAAHGRAEAAAHFWHCPLLPNV